MHVIENYSFTIDLLMLLETHSEYFGGNMFLASQVMRRILRSLCHNRTGHIQLWLYLSIYSHGHRG